MDNITPNLHSTMYLLKRANNVDKCIGVKFTFHYVSIKTVQDKLQSYQLSYLHSTMYLLKQTATETIIRNYAYLHSTMYLLKLFLS